MQKASGKRQAADRMGKWAMALVASVLVGLLIVGVAAAQGGKVTDDQVNAVAKQLNCPVCENVPLDVCETQACAQWRDLIRQKLATGDKPEQIIAYFRATYGDRVLQSPPREGFTGLVWILPFVGLMAGVAILIVVLRRMAAQPKAEAGVEVEAGADAGADEYRKRLERELKELDR
jgi:cytochrome c-type biogenesis protein CcmH